MCAPLPSTALAVSSKVQVEGRDFPSISSAAFPEKFSKNGGRGDAPFSEGEHKDLDKRELAQFEGRKKRRVAGFKEKYEQR